MDNPFIGHASFGVVDEVLRKPFAKVGLRLKPLDFAQVGAPMSIICEKSPKASSFDSNESFREEWMYRTSGSNPAWASMPNA